MLKNIDKCEIWAVDPEKVKRARRSLLPDKVFSELAETFSALSDFNRAKILYSLLDAELCVCDIAAVIGMSESATSQHLRVLRTIHLVKQRKEGRMVYYSMNDDHMNNLLKAYLEHIKKKKK